MQNLIKNPDRAIKAMVKIEGTDWLKRQRAGQYKTCSVFDAIEELKKRGCPRKNDISITTVIYGRAGWNRYCILETGEVCFIELQGSPANVKKAQKLGFRIR